MVLFLWNTHALKCLHQQWFPSFELCKQRIHIVNLIRAIMKYKFPDLIVVFVFLFFHGIIRVRFVLIAGVVPFAVRGADAYSEVRKKFVTRVHASEAAAALKTATLAKAGSGSPERRYSAG